MSVTINDVAKYAGVSMKTVSRVINNEISVSKTTRGKVTKAVKALNYYPNNSARNLAGSRSYTIAYIYDNPNAYYIIDMQNGILSECKANHYELLIHPCKYQSANLAEELKNLVTQSRLAGVVLTPPFSESSSVIKIFESMQVPFVRIISGANEEKPSDSCIFINDREAAHSITQHLVKLGHQKIGFLCGGKQHHSSFERLQGFKSALTENGIQPDNNLIIEGEYSFDSGVMGAKQLLTAKSRPTAIFASNDEMAAGALFAARLMGISIPQELSIAGFEDSPFSRQTWPKLTTAHQPNQEIAQQATKLLIAKIQQKTGIVETKNLKRNFSPKLVIRDSTGSFI